MARLIHVQGADEPVPLSVLVGKRNVVLLGDPGSGKSASMQALAEASGSVRRTVHGSLALGDTARLPPGPLFLDGLDETMASQRRLSPLDDVVERLHGFGWREFWLSCRPADWAQTGGEALLAECLPEKLVVARLLPLDDVQVHAIVSAAGFDPEELFGTMRAAGLNMLLGNPETLRLILSVLASGGPPTSRADLYSRAVSQLARECNPEHARRRSQVSDEQLLRAAGALSAMLLLSGRSLVSTAMTDDRDCVPLEACSGLADDAHLRAALASRLFAASGEDAWEPAHRTIAEYLAARSLARQVAVEGRPLRMVVALLCGDDTTPEPSLRGLFAWLAVALPDRAAEFVARDPYAVATYGDLTVMRVGARRALIEGLERLSETEPFFRAGSWHEASFAALAVPELECSLRGVITMRPVGPHLLSCVLDAIRASNELLPGLVADLGHLITDDAVDRDIRTAAIFAFARTAPDAEASGLFVSILADDTADPRAHLAGRLLLELYPRVLTNEDLVTFLERYVSTDRARGDRLHLSIRLPQLVPPGSEADLLDRLSSSEWPTDKSPGLSRLSEVKALALRLAATALNGAAPLKAGRVITWIPLLAGGGRSRSDVKTLSDALTARPDLFVPVLLAACDLAPDRDRDNHWRARVQLYRHCPWFPPPPDATERVLDAVEADPDGPDAPTLYAGALGFLPSSADARSTLFERAWRAGNMSPGLAGVRAEAMTVSLEYEAYRWEDRERTAKFENEQQKVAARLRADLRRQVKAIRSGKAVNALGLLASAWYSEHGG